MKGKIVLIPFPFTDLTAAKLRPAVVLFEGESARARLLEARLELRKLARNWRFWSGRVSDAAKEVLGLCEVLVFGSVVEGHVTGASDVDVLIVCDQLPKNCKGRGNIKAKIEEAAGLPLYHPFEIHLATREEAEANPIYRTAAREGVSF